MLIPAIADTQTAQKNRPAAVRTPTAIVTRQESSAVTGGFGGLHPHRPATLPAGGKVVNIGRGLVKKHARVCLVGIFGWVASARGVLAALDTATGQWPLTATAAE